MKRFEKVYSQGMVDGIRIYVDQKTGVNYLYIGEGYGGGLTPLLDSEGNIVVTPIVNDEKQS